MNPTREEQLEKARALMDKHGLHEWRVNFADLSQVPTKTLTGASYGAQGICIFQDRKILVDLNVTRYQFLQVVKHEIAHALLGWPGHGDAWLEIAKRVGCSERSLSVYRMVARVDSFTVAA